MIVTKLPFAKAVCVLGLVVVTMAGKSSIVFAAEPQTGEREHIMAEIDRQLSDDEARQAAMRAGEARSSLCVSCHGADGNSARPDIPNLAEQNMVYFIEQINKFADDRRKHFVMPVLARDFSFQDKVNLAIYFTSQKLKAVDGDQALAAKGKPLYEKFCIRCHGDNGKGQAGYARIAGQKIDYVVTTLKRFRDNVLKNDGLDETKRTDRGMEMATSQLSDEDIEALAHYAALMK